MFSVVVFLLGIVCFNSIQAIDYFDMADKFDAEDIDELTRIAWRCTWLIMCDFHKIFEIKTIMDEVKPEDRTSSVNLTDYMIEKCEGEEISEECERLTYAAVRHI
ncbi:uncharacterized protein TNIN_247611 [Trichonephila inaurata madagascariensis]|uniref:Uncharacterized protein n=1 Tax=Trichonephila inaurata madagascariensis TaxID=2747483 RepID=A0A8X6JHD7_9ARAC|nr:uncharacterized protein TNIN_247611 [Trichonephila inaurata madagascariensis]